eukprot:gene4302-4587_t
MCRPGAGDATASTSPVPATAPANGACLADTMEGWRHEQLLRAESEGRESDATEVEDSPGQLVGSQLFDEDLTSHLHGQVVNDADDADQAVARIIPDTHQDVSLPILPGYLKKLRLPEARLHREYQDGLRYSKSVHQMRMFLDGPYYCKREPVPDHVIAAAIQSLHKKQFKWSHKDGNLTDTEHSASGDQSMNVPPRPSADSSIAPECRPIP